MKILIVEDDLNILSLLKEHLKEEGFIIDVAQSGADGEYFKSLHNYLEVKSPIYSKEEILKSSKILNPVVEVLNYELKFDNPVKLLEYIKFSGVSGNVKVNIGKLKNFIRHFPNNILEFEIVVLKSHEY
jgi:uncharacterized protein involved in exopolysaccharide biosynthesis